MKWILVEEQEQEEGSESETAFVDLGEDTLLNVLNRVDVHTLGRAACVNKLCRKLFEEIGIVALDEEALFNVLKRVDAITLGRAACVNKLWRTAANDERLWEPIARKLRISRGGLESINKMIDIIRQIGFRRYVHQLYLGRLVEPLPADFNSIDLSKKVEDWVQSKGKISLVEPPPPEFNSIDVSRNTRYWVQNKDKISFQFPIPRMWRIAVADDFGDV